MQVEINALEEMFEIENTIASAFEDFDLVIEAFHETTVLSLNEVVGDFLPPGREQFQEIVKTVQATLLNLLDPAQDFGLGLFLGKTCIEDGREPFSQSIGEFCSSRMLEEVSQDFAFFFAQVLGVFSKRSKTAIQCLIFCFWQGLLQTQKLLFAHLIGSGAIMFGNMKAVHHDPGTWDLLS